MVLDKNAKRKYRLKGYDPNWVKKFDQIKLLLRSVFGDKALKIEHVGSTAIPNIKAKPVIDVLVVVKKMEAFTAQKEKMTSLGYLWDKNYIAPNTLIFYKVAEDGGKIENIHVCELGSPKEKQFLVMRDFFRAFPEKSKEYAALKEKNFAAYPDNYPAYRAAKAPFLQRMEQEAYQWDKQHQDPRRPMLPKQIKTKELLKSDVPRVSAPIGEKISFILSFVEESEYNTFMKDISHNAKSSGLSVFSKRLESFRAKSLENPQELTVDEIRTKLLMVQRARRHTGEPYDYEYFQNLFELIRGKLGNKNGF